MLAKIRTYSNFGSLNPNLTWVFTYNNSTANFRVANLHSYISHHIEVFRCVTFKFILCLKNILPHLSVYSKLDFLKRKYIVYNKHWGVIRSICVKFCPFLIKLHWKFLLCDGSSYDCYGCYAYLLNLIVNGQFFFKLGGGRALEGIIYQKGAVLLFEHVITVTFKSFTL